MTLVLSASQLQPILDGVHQPGITDPQWPVKPPRDVDGAEYLRDYAGRVARQQHMALAVIDLPTGVTGRQLLGDVLKSLSDFAYREMRKRPSRSHLPYLAKLPESYRATVTVGLGWKLFRTETGEDRFGIDHLRPKALLPLEPFPGDGPLFDPGSAAGDFIVIVCSDHPYVNVAIVRALAHGYVHRALHVKQIEQGFDRPDKREFLRFDDGIDNLSNAREGELDRHVYVQESDAEPEWCVGGSYLVHRKVREDLVKWEGFSEQEQEQMIGRRKRDGRPLTRLVTGPSGMVPVYWDDKGQFDPAFPPNAHTVKVQPRRPFLDLFGKSDLDRRFLRRPYPFFQGLGPTGDVQCGLQFLAFMRNLQEQFDWVTRMWQMNPDFPIVGAGIDAMYANQILETVGGGYYFCPPAPQGRKAFLGSRLITTT